MNQWMKLRIGAVFFSFFIFLSLVIFRLVQLQVLPNSALSRLSKRQFVKTDQKAPFRIPIVDRNKQELALSVPVSSLYAHPNRIKSRKRTARALAKELGKSTSYWLKKLDPKKNFVWLERQAAEKKASRIKSLKLPGIGVESENKRIYPNGPLAAHVLGFTDIDGNGLSGLELSLNSLILQEKQRLKFSKDGKGNTSYIEKKKLDEVNDSEGIVLTLDRRIQSMVESEVERVRKETKAKAVMAVVMNPKNGEILALAQKPSFDPNHPSQSSTDTLRNKVVQSLYEPGSTLKVLFAADAIEKGLLTPNSEIDCGGGKIKIGKTTISESDKKHQHKRLTLEKVIAYSSNVGAVRVAQTLGVKGTKELVQRYGLDQKTGIELAAESFGQDKPSSEITPLILANMGFGQGISMTPLQLVTAFSPFANGGILVSPTLLREDDENHSTNGERIISEETAEMVKNILVAVTEDEKGTGYQAKISGIQVAGKTGTAQKFDPIQGYKSNKYYSSFVGFLPARDPQLLIGVMIDEPTSQYYASQIASPLFKSIAEQSLYILNRGPAQALSKSQSTKPVAQKVLPHFKETAKGKWKLPDFTGLSLNEAMTILNKYIDKVEISGNGYVTSQFPQPDSLVDKNTPLKLQLKGFDD